MKKTRNYDFQQFLHIPERGHIWSQVTLKQIKMQKKTQLNMFHVKTNNIKRVQDIFRLKY